MPTTANQSHLGLYCRALYELIDGLPAVSNMNDMPNMVKELYALSYAIDPIPSTFCTVCSAAVAYVTHEKWQNCNAVNAHS
jgi:hypothetical protein